MRKRSIDVSAENETEALSEGASQLSTPVENLTVSILSKGTYRVKLVRVGAEVQIKVSDDNMLATVEQYLAPTGGGSPLEIELLQEFLKEAGVIYGIDEGELANIVKSAQDGKNIRGRALAKGKSPEKAIDSTVCLAGDLRRPVFPGMTVCHKTEPCDGVSGMDIRGVEIPPEAGDKAKAVELTALAGVKLSEDGTVAVASIYGLGVINNSTVEVTPLFTVSEDALSVTATLYKADSDGDEITTERIVEALKREELTNAVATAAIDASLSRIKGNAKSPGDVVEDVVVMTGVAPEDGTDGRLEMAIDDKKQSGILDKNGQMDYRERSTFRSVKKGDQLARLIPPGAGKPGVDVRGGGVSPREGGEMKVVVGENVVSAEDGHLFTAGIDGVLVHVGEHISVADVIEIQGDVDYEAGNVHIEKGSILIKGGIRTGFVVEVKGNILVEDGIGGAEVEAGGDIEVKRGLTMHGKGNIIAHGSLSALFAENASVEVDGDIDVSNNISNCHIIAGGKIRVVSGKGVIVGGDLWSNGGVEANEIGSELGVETHITIGIDSREKQKLIKEKQSLQDSIHKVILAFGEGDARSILTKAERSKRFQIAKVLKARVGMLAAISRIDEQLQAIIQEEKSREKSSVVIQKTLHPGVFLSICGQHLEIKQAVAHCCIRYDSGGDRLRITSIDAA